MPSPESSTALLVLDFQVGLTGTPFAMAALAKATEAIDIARSAGLRVIYSRVGFRAGYSDVATWNPVFGSYASRNLLPIGSSILAPELTPQPDEPVVVKSRFSPFAGTDLTVVLRSQEINEIAIAGISTSGVVLAAFVHAENEDIPVTILEDACGDPDVHVHDTLVDKVFPRSGVVTMVDEWQPLNTHNRPLAREDLPRQ